MPKKRGKSKAKHISRKKAKKPKASKAPKAKEEPQQKAEIPHVDLKDALRDLEILAEEKKVGQKVDQMEKREEKIEQKEVQIAKEEKKIVKEAQKVEGIERKIEKEVASKPLTNFSMKDLNKGIVGAFIGVVAHFGFIYGSVIADKITTIRALMLLIFSYLLIVILMYETGYRDIKEKRLMGFLPKRATFIFITSIIVVMAIFFLFNMVDQKDPVGFFKQVAVTSVLASLGAGTADLLGRH